MKALLKNYHQPSRKVRLVADLIRGKSVSQAREALTYLPKKSSPVNSAVSNAGQPAENLFVKTITVNKGAVMKRARPFARGRSGTIHKEMSIIFIELGLNAAPKAAKSKKIAKSAQGRSASGGKAAAKAESASAKSSGPLRQSSSDASETK